MNAPRQPATYRFLDFELNLGTHELRRAGVPVRLERRPFELLALLVQRRGQLVTREEIIAAMWPARVVIDFETGVNTLVRKVRHALGDSADNPAFVATVAGVGYRFIAPLDEAPAPVPEQPVVATPERQTPRRKGALAILVLLAVSAGIFVWQRAVDAPAHTRIVVLPFENLSGNQQLDYLASGLADETSTSLAQIDLPDLAVIGGTSARALAGSEAPLRELGRELDIDFVVQSSLRQDATKIRVTSRLLRVRDGAQVWSASFDRELTNVLGLQRELSIAIAEQVRQRLAPDIVAAIDRRQTENPRAYELYLKGRYQWQQLSPASIRRALDFFEQAVAEDSDYALAWAGIAETLATSSVTVGARPGTAVDTARHALERALAIDPGLSEVQNARAAFHYFVEWDYATAAIAAREAVRLDPNSAMAHMRLGIVLVPANELVEAREMMRRARELDPLFPLMFANSAVVALAQNDYQAGMELAKQSIAINPELWAAYQYLGYAQLALGDHQAALQSFSEMEKHSDARAHPQALRAYALTRLGMTEDARSILRELQARAQHEYVPPYAIATVYAGLGEIDTAFEWLDRALAVRDSGLLGLAHSITLASLREDPRFPELLQRCGFPPAPDMPGGAAR